MLCGGYRGTEEGGGEGGKKRMFVRFFSLRTFEHALTRDDLTRRKNHNACTFIKSNHLAQKQAPVVGAVRAIRAVTKALKDACKAKIDFSAWAWVFSLSFFFFFFFIVFSPSLFSFQSLV